MQYFVLLMIYYVKSGAAQEFKHTLVLDNGFAKYGGKTLTHSLFTSAVADLENFTLGWQRRGKRSRQGGTSSVMYV